MGEDVFQRKTKNLLVWRRAFLFHDSSWLMIQRSPMYSGVFHIAFNNNHQTKKGWPAVSWQCFKVVSHNSDNLGRIDNGRKLSCKISTLLVGGAITILKHMKVNGKDYLPSPIYESFKPPARMRLVASFHWRQKNTQINTCFHLDY